MDDSAFDCSICQDKLSEAIETKCCHHCFCKQCIEDWLTRKNSCPSCRKALTLLDIVPNVPIQRLIDSLPGECPHIKRGCTAKLTRGNVKEHVINFCEFVNVLCANQCGITVYKKDLVSHQQQTCSKRLIPCVQCTTVISLDGMPEHISTTCPKSRIMCPNCKTMLIREQLLCHQTRECNKIELTCPFEQFGCKFKGLRPAYNAHMIDDSDLHVGIVLEREAEISKLKKELQAVRYNNNQPLQHNLKPALEKKQPVKNPSVAEPVDVVMDLQNSQGGSIVESSNATVKEWKAALIGATKCTIRCAQKVSSFSLKALFNYLDVGGTMRELVFERCSFDEDCVNVIYSMSEALGHKVNAVWLKYCSVPKSCRDILRALEFSQGVKILSPHFV